MRGLRIRVKRRIQSVVRDYQATEITRTNNIQGFNENKVTAIKGGKRAGNARKELESKTGKKNSEQRKLSAL